MPLFQKIFFLTCFVILLGGCTSPLPGDVEITMSIGGLPTVYSRYYLEVCTYTQERKLSAEIFTSPLENDQLWEISKKIAPETTRGVCFLYSSEDFSQSPLYTAGFAYTPEKSLYSLLYWLDFRAFHDEDIIRYGISRQIYAELETSFTGSFDFNTNPYFLIRFPEMSGEEGKFSFSNLQGSIDVLVTSNFDDLLDFRTSSELSVTTGGDVSTGVYTGELWVLLLPGRSSDTVRTDISITRNFP